MDSIFNFKHSMREILLGEYAGYKVLHYPFNQPNLLYQLLDTSNVVVGFHTNLENLIQDLSSRLKLTTRKITQ